MSSLRRIVSKSSEVSTFIFTIDTTKIVSGATNGSENPLQFKIPLSNIANASTNCVVKVSDGRPDITMIGQTDVNNKSLLNNADILFLFN